MPKLTIEQRHTYAPDEVKRRLQGLADRLASKYGLDARWTSERTAEIKRTGATGLLTLGDERVTVTLDLSFALTPLKGKIEEKIRRELSQALA